MPGVHTVICYMEGVQNGRNFMAAADKAPFSPPRYWLTRSSARASANALPSPNLEWNGAARLSWPMPASAMNQFWLAHAYTNRML